MMSRLAHLAGTWLYRTRALHLARRRLAPVTRARFALVFHGVAARRDPGIAPRAQPPHDAAALAATLRWLRAQGYAFLTPEAFLDGRQPGVLLTFDDGLANNVTVALPILAQFNAPALFFVTTQHVQAPSNWLPATRAIARRHWPSTADVPRALAAEWYDGMSADQLAVCSAHPLITIGAHTVSHPALTACGADELRYQVSADRAYLESVTGRPVTLFAYPTGLYDTHVLNAVAAAGYTAAFAVDPLPVGRPQFEIPRIGLYAAEPAYLLSKLSGLHRRPLPLLGDA